MPRLSLLAAAIAGLLVTALIIGAGHFAANNLITAQQNRQLAELAELALRRAESNVEFGRDALADLSARQLTNCENATLQNVRFQVYEWGPVKDIRIARPNGSVRCSAFSETLEFDRSWPTRDEMVPASAGDLSLFRVEQYSGVAMGVLVDVNSETSLVAILATTAALIDVMPEELRGSSNVAVEITGDETIAEMRPDMGGRIDDQTMRITAESGMYPLRSVIEVHGLAMAGWNREAYWPVVALAAALGIVAGLFVTRCLIRPRSPGQRLEQAIAANEIKPFPQPLFDLESGQIIGCEILARWVRPTGEIISPARFIPLAEETGCIEELTWKLLSSALADLRGLMSRNKSFVLSFNVSPSHFIKPEFVGDIRRIVTDARVAFRQISIEITERQPFDDIAVAAANVRALQDLGFKVSLDDVGIGHSGLSHLHSLGANTLKIDKFFVDSIDSDTTAKSIIEMLVRLAARLGMNIVAEGIELQSQVDALRACGVTRGQGYIVSPPVPMTDFLDMAAAATGARQDEPEISAA